MVKLTEIKRGALFESKDLFRNIFQFYCELRYNGNNMFSLVKHSIKARRHLEGSFILLKNMIEPETNDYILKEDSKNQCFHWFEGNIGRMFKDLDNKEAPFDILIKSSTTGQNASMIVRVDEYRQFLTKIMEQAILYPIKQTNKRFKDFNGTLDNKEIKKDYDLYIYFLFLNMYHSSQVLGALTKEKPMTPGKGNSPLFGPSLSPIPKGVRTNEKEDEEDDTTQQVEQYFTENFDD